MGRVDLAPHHGGATHGHVESAIVTRNPSALRGTSLPDASNTVSWTAPQKPTGSGFRVGVTVTVHGVCAKAIAGASMIALSTIPAQRRRSAMRITAAARICP
jgi:hypothetical protein